MEVWTLWHPTYWLSGLLKAITAVVSLYTAAELCPLIPQALALPSPAQLEATNNQLMQEISDRTKAEAALLESQKMLQLVMDNIPQLLCWKDRDFIYLGCNRKLAQTTGFKIQRMLWVGHTTTWLGA
jgi:PAS domain-containing protein